MKTLYAACLSRVGLSQADAAVLHGCRPDTVKSWCTGRRTVPAGAWDDLRAYEARITGRAAGENDMGSADPHLLLMAGAVTTLEPHGRHKLMRVVIKGGTRALNDEERSAVDAQLLAACKSTA